MACWLFWLRVKSKRLEGGRAEGEGAEKRVKPQSGTVWERTT